MRDACVVEYDKFRACKPVEACAVVLKRWETKIKTEACVCTGKEPRTMCSVQVQLPFFFKKKCVISAHLWRSQISAQSITEYFC